jgi:glycine cleavage system aminomethyltransferase T
VEEREVGQVTSAVCSTRLGKPLALGYVRRDFATAGVTLKWNKETVEVLRVCGE